MKIAKFIAKCPFEVGDEFILADGCLALITDILTTHSYKSGLTEFLYELNNSGRYVRFQLPKEAADD